MNDERPLNPKLRTQILDRYGYVPPPRTGDIRLDNERRRDAYEARIRKLTDDELALEASKRGSWMFDLLRREVERRGLERLPMKKDVTDTSQLAKTPVGAALILDNLTGRRPFGGAIEAQEARGQQELVNSEQLPTECPTEHVVALEKAGVAFGPPTPNDPIFRKAVLPDGWKKEATGHSMHSNLVDNKGRIRATLFYKAAFYDRNAYMRAVSRYKIDFDFDLDERGRPRGQQRTCLAQVKDGDKVLFETPRFEEKPYPERGGPDWSTFKDNMTLAREAAEEWLNANFPQWKDVSAYWDT